MLQRRKPKRSGIERAPERAWRRHETWIRGFTCVAFKADASTCEGRKVECCHYRTAANSGTGIKPGSWSTFPACSEHHAEQHRIGQPAFERKYGVNLITECRRLARISPDAEMKKAAREAGFI